MDPARDIVSLPAPSGDAVPLYRSPPQNIEAEQQLLGAILINNDAATKVQAFLLPDHFAEAIHGRIYAAATRLIERGEIANPVTLKSFFERDEGLADIGGTAYLARLAAAAATLINAENYGRVIYDLALRRELIRIGGEMAERAYDAGLDEMAKEQIETAEQQLFTLAEDGQIDGGFVPFKNALALSVGMIDAAYRHGGLSGVATGLRDLDSRLGGLHRSDLVILAGRPSMGKTALATIMAFNAARLHHQTEGAEGAVVGFFSLEMSAEQLATRILSTETRLSSAKLRRGEIGDDEFTHRIVPANQLLSEVPFFIDDTGGLTISALRTRARRLKRTHGLGLVVVDYLQLMRASGRQRNDNRVQEISEITQGLKALAKDLDVPVLALSQLSRAVETRDNQRPQLADLRDSGAIEQDADVVMFVYREEYYKARKKPHEDTAEFAQWQQEIEKVHGLADVIIGKQRHGPIGDVTLAFEAEFTRFSDLVPDDHLPAVP